MIGGVSRALVSGLGGIGQRHCRNLRELIPGVRIAAWRRRESPEPDESLRSLVHEFLVVESDVARYAPEVAILAGPAGTHLAQASVCVGLGCAVLIEKPLAVGLEGVAELEESVRSRRVPAVVGYNFRFYEPLRVLKEALDSGAIGKPLGALLRVGQYLPDWRPTKDYRSSVSTQRALGGGALMELSHELDLSLWLFGAARSVIASTAKVSTLMMDVEDVADLIVNFESGVQANIHLDMIQRTPDRSCRVLGSEGTLECDLLTHSVRRLKPGLPVEVLYESQTLDRNAMYLSELRHLLDLRERGGINQSSLADGRRALELILAARASADRGVAVTL